MWSDGASLAPAGAQAALSALYQSVQARRASHEALLSLSGRLELLREQLDKAVSGVHTQRQLEPRVRAHCQRLWISFMSCSWSMVNTYCLDASV